MRCIDTSDISPAAGHTGIYLITFLSVYIASHAFLITFPTMLQSPPSGELVDPRKHGKKSSGFPPIPIHSFLFLW
jgi:hypothetical protein